MELLYVHSSFPAQFGHLAARIASSEEHHCTFVTEADVTDIAGISIVRYERDGEVARPTHFLARAFDGDVRNAMGIYHALRERVDVLHPDLIIGHALLGPTLLLDELFPDVPVIGYFEDYAAPWRLAAELRPEWPRRERDRLRARSQRATSLLHLEACAAGYTPTAFQHSLLPESYRPKVRVIHDGIDTDFWRVSRETQEFSLPRVVTYVARTLDPMRGFDIFMRTAKLIYQEFPDVVFYVVGTEGEGYGDEHRHFPDMSFKEFVLARDDYDLDRFQFVDWIAPEALVQLLGMSDLHIYLTTPFVLSWSLLNAMASGCVVLASDTEPVHDVIVDGENGLLRPFFDVESLAAAGLEVLRRPEEHRALGYAAERTIREEFSLDATLPRMLAFYEEVARG